MFELHHGDCLAVMRDIPSGSVDCVITDPPYALTSGGAKAVTMGGIFSPQRYDNGGKLFACVKFAEWLPDVFRVMKPDADLYVLVNDKNVQDALNAATGAGFRFHNILVWDKGMVTPNRWYMKSCEFALYFWKGRAVRINNMGSNQLASVPADRNKQHPTQKPTALLRKYIQNSTAPGQTILDPFMGSGSTGVACLLENRKFIGIEKDAGYFEIAKNRIEQTLQREPLFA